MTSLFSWSFPVLMESFSPFFLFQRGLFRLFWLSWANWTSLTSACWRTRRSATWSTRKPRSSSDWTAAIFRSGPRSRTDTRQHIKTEGCALYKKWPMADSGKQHEMEWNVLPACGGHSARMYDKGRLGVRNRLNRCAVCGPRCTGERRHCVKEESTFNSTRYFGLC